jgi:hypothetical protein
MFYRSEDIAAFCAVQALAGAEQQLEPQNRRDTSSLDFPGFPLLRQWA